MVRAHLRFVLKRYILLKLISVLVLLSIGQVSLADSDEPAIVFNQAGYQTEWPKRALLINKPQSSIVTLRDAETDALIMMIKPKETGFSDLDSTQVEGQLLDFSKIEREGLYYLEDGELRSPNFRIGEKVYKEATRLLLRSYYLQRCGVELLDPETGLSHEACHLNDGVYARDDEFNKEGLPRDAAGGWHDAGDYGKYIAPATVTVNRLLSLYLMAPERYPDEALSTPESGNGISDLLDEVKFELDWMLRMQRADGAIYRKLSGAKWPKVISPENDTQPRYIYGVSSPETGKFISSMAIAFRAYKDIDTDLANSYLAAAKKSWLWLQQQPEQTIDWEKSDDSGSGGYMASEADTEVQLDIDRDDRLTAALELYLATGETLYRDFILANQPNEIYSLYEWKDASSLSLWHLMQFDKSDQLVDIRNDIKNKLLDRADRLLQQIQTSAFNVANDRLIWGSNKMTAEEGITLAHAWYLTGEKQYLEGALDQLDFLLGKNPFNMSFVTAVGHKSVQNPVHIFGRSVKKTLPGLMVGGPNNLAQDGIAPKNKGLMSYVDNERAYSVNEYAIDYNASLIGLLEILAIYKDKIKDKAEEPGSFPDVALEESTLKDVADISEPMLEELSALVNASITAELAVTQLSASEEGTLEKVLFIGNSFTYYNNSLHYHVEQLRRNTMSTKAFAPYNFRAATIAGGYWYEQMANADYLTEGKEWDAVVLQGHSTEAIDEDKKGIFRDSLKDSRDLLLKRGIKPFLFMTWAYQHKPEMIEQLEPSYKELAATLNVDLVPVGTAFHKSLSLRPELKLHARDGIHPSRAGTYLAACVFYASFYNETPVGLAYDMELPKETSSFLQKIAADVSMKGAKATSALLSAHVTKVGFE
jgi:endoglucanase